MAGLDPTTGLTIRTQPELQELLEAALVAAYPGLNTRAGPIQQMIGVLSEELALAWETLQALYAAAYPDSASGILLDQISVLTGTTRRAATRSRVDVRVALAAGVTLPAGSIVAVVDNPDAQFRLIEGFTNTTGVLEQFTLEFESVELGPVAAPIGTLTVIVTPVSGWTVANNVDASATLGELVAEDDELRAQRIVELAGAGSGTLASIKAAVARVDGVIEVNALENTSLTTDGNGLPGKAFEVIVWDGDTPVAEDDEIAQKIFDHKPAGILAHGAAESGNAVDEIGTTHVVDFTRATRIRIYVDVDVVLVANPGSEWEDQIQDAIMAAVNGHGVGETVYASTILCAVLDGVPAVRAVTVLTVDDITPPVSTSFTPAYDEIARVIGIADVTVTEV